LGGRRIIKKKAQRGSDCRIRARDQSRQDIGGESQGVLTWREGLSSGHEFSRSPRPCAGGLFWRDGRLGGDAGHPVKRRPYSLPLFPAWRCSVSGTIKAPFPGCAPSIRQRPAKILTRPSATSLSASG